MAAIVVAADRFISLNIMKKNIINLGGRLVGQGRPVYVMAEGGLTNWGQLRLAKKQVDAALAAGCDAVKFQAQTTEEMVSKKVSPHWYGRVKYKELSHKELKELWAYCKKKKIQCCVTAHTDVDLEFLDKELNVPFFKVGSGESMNQDFLKNVGSRGKPVIMSLGLHLNEKEIKQSVQTLEKSGCGEIVIMHCNTIYPTPPEQNNLGEILRLKKMFDYPVGYSDHSAGWHIPLASVALGASLIEKHISFDLKDKRSLDCPGSCTPEMLKRMVNEIREIEKALAKPKKNRKEEILKSRKWASQSIVAGQDIKKGDLITAEKLKFKRPGIGLSPDKKNTVIGRQAKKNISADELILQSSIK